MEVNRLNINLEEEKTFKDNIPTGGIFNNKIDLKNKNSKSSKKSKMMTKKSEDLFYKFSFSEKKINPDYYNQSYNNDDSILENLKSKGLLNKTLENKFNDYKNEIKKTKLKERNISKISLINEMNLINKNMNIANIEQENLIQIKELKLKKIDILINSISNINKRIRYINEKGLKNNEYNLKNLNLNKNVKNILIQHYEIFSYDLIKNFYNKEKKYINKIEEVISYLLKK